MAVEAYFNAETIWCAEYDKYASQLIEQKLGYLNHGDIKKINWADVEPIDILTAGYPCQPFSSAGERKGTTDDRHIFPFILEAISTLRPRWVVLENVRGHLSLGFKEVLASLTGIGYDARWQVVRASDVGAPHQRARLFIVADSNSHAHTQPRRADRGLSEQSQGLRDGQDQGQARHKYRSSAEMARQELPNTLDELGRLNAAFVEYMMGLPKGWVSETNLARSQQLKILGNGVVPQQAYYALQLLLNSDTPSEQDLC